MTSKSCCNPGFVLDPMFGSCLRCNANMGCFTCSGSRCTSCVGGTFLSSSTFRCISCSASCNGCFGTADNCTACAAGYVRSSPSLGSACLAIPSCTGGTFVNGSICSPCSSSCASCQYTSFYCTSCSASLYLVNGTCLNCDHSCL